MILKEVIRTQKFMATSYEYEVHQCGFFIKLVLYAIVSKVQMYGVSFHLIAIQRSRPSAVADSQEPLRFKLLIKK